MTVDMQSALLKKIETGIQAYVTEAQEDCIRRAVSDFEIELRRRVGTCAIQVADLYSVERLRNELVIRIQVDK